MDYNSQLQKNGYFLLENVFTEEEINGYKNDVLNFKKNNKTISSTKGITIPDFIKHEQLKNVSEIRNNVKINDVLKQIFDNDYRFCSHNDIGINRVVGWHKDKLNNSYAKYQTIDIWSESNGEKHEIVKVLIYLQDHSNNNDGLKIIPGSHLVKSIKTKNIYQLKPKIGDVVIFDQRITHRGMERQVPNSRILVSFGFGKNNVFTDNFEKGTIKRQNDQNI